MPHPPELGLIFGAVAFALAVGLLFAAVIFIVNRRLENEQAQQREIEQQHPPVPRTPNDLQ